MINTYLWSSDEFQYDNVARFLIYLFFSTVIGNSRKFSKFFFDFSILIRLYLKTETKIGKKGLVIVLNGSSAFENCISHHHADFRFLDLCTNRNLLVPQKICVSIKRMKKGLYIVPIEHNIIENVIPVIKPEISTNCTKIGSIFVQ